MVDLRASDPEQDTSSLPSSQTDSDDITTSESDDEELDANQQWQESLEQLELLLSMVIVPYAGKYFGRKFAFWGMQYPKVLERKPYDSLGRRLEAVHGVDVSCRSRRFQQRSVQRHGNRSGRFPLGHKHPQRCSFESFDLP